MAGACPSKACVLFKPKRGPAVRRASWPLAGLGGDVRQEAVAGGTGQPLRTSSEFSLPERPVGLHVDQRQPAMPTQMIIQARRPARSSTWPAALPTVAGRAATGPVTTNNDGSVTDGGSCSQASSQRDRDRDIDADPNSS